MTQTTAWLLLVIAGLCEVGFTTCMKLSDNFSDWRWTTGFAVFMTASILLLNKSLEVIPLGTGYAVWTGIGALGTVLVGIFFWNEPVTIWRVTFLFLLIASIIGLKFVG